jgi:hypothetical protein
VSYQCPAQKIFFNVSMNLPENKEHTGHTGSPATRLMTRVPGSHFAYKAFAGLEETSYWFLGPAASGSREKLVQGEPLKHHTSK